MSDEKLKGREAILAVLARTAGDSQFLARLADNPAEALKDYDLTTEEKAALAGGDIKWVQSKRGTLYELLRTWLIDRLAPKSGKMG